MPNAIQSKQVVPAKFITVPSNDSNVEEPGYGFVGAMAGFIFYWLAFSVPFFIYGANALFFMLYTWPFFLALIPVSVLIGLIFSVLMNGRLLWMIPCIGIAVFCLFWLVFALLTGW